MDPVLVPVWPETAQMLGIGRSTVFRLIADGELPSVRIGRRRLVPVAGVRDYAARLAARQTGAPDGDAAPQPL
jgi:excisionase family DNA binding protein